MSTTINPSAPADVKEAKPKKKRERAARKPLYELAEGVKLEVTPDDFNSETHRMSKAQFKDLPCWMEHQALLAERRAVDLRAKAAEYRINPPKRAAGAKKAKLVARLAKLEAKLSELGVNVADLFGDDEDSE